MFKIVKKMKNSGLKIVAGFTTPLKCQNKDIGLKTIEIQRVPIIVHQDIAQFLKKWLE